MLAVPQRPRGVLYPSRMNSPWYSQAATAHFLWGEQPALAVPSGEQPVLFLVALILGGALLRHVQGISYAHPSTPQGVVRKGENPKAGWVDTPRGVNNQRECNTSQECQLHDCCTPEQVKRHFTGRGGGHWDCSRVCHIGVPKLN